ncbi:MAG TPA: MarR family transcriptional regulator [Lactobacillus sp.]|nr:MarR family transcriptional regulator [Lactobacillus sp.]
MDGRKISDLVRSIGIKQRMMADTHLRELGINAVQGRVIGYIADHQDHGVIQRELATAVQRRSASITSVLQGLEKRGLIERRVPADNGRNKQLYLTAAGQALVLQYDSLAAKINGQTVAGLTDAEMTAAVKLLTRINQNLPEI